MLNVGQMAETESNVGVESLAICARVDKILY